jgi:hypothetical protein
MTPRRTEAIHDPPRMLGGDSVLDADMTELAERMLDPSTGSELALRSSKGQAVHKQLPKAKTPHEQESLKRTIAATDHQIDALVYELYGLTEAEIAVVEGPA